jgi:hypothetical protein
MRDWISGFVGLIVLLIGLLPMLGYISSLNELKPPLLSWIVLIAGFYLMMNSIIELTNSNVIGKVSLMVAIAALLIGLFPVLHGFGIGPGWFEFGWINRTLYNIIFIIEGIFLMIATFAMEL